MEDTYRFIRDIEKYNAHVIEDKENGIVRRELLTEHTDCTRKYFKILSEEKHLNKMLERFVAEMFGELSADGFEFFREMIVVVN